MLKKNSKIRLVTLMRNVGKAFMAIKILYDEGLIQLDDELKIRRNLKEKNPKTKVLISIRKKNKLNSSNMKFNQ